MERLECRLSKLCVCLLCTLRITLGTNGEIGQTGSQSNPHSSRSLVFHAALLHAGHAVESDSPHTSGERWCLGWPGSLESSCLAPRSDLVDAQRGYVARAPELLLQGEIAARMVQFDRDIDCYEKTSGENFPNNIRIGVALRMLPDGPLKQHLVLNSARLTTWETLKAEIDNVRRAQAAASSTPQPKRMSQGDDIPKTPCPICGKTGHWKRDCWHNEANRKHKGKGKDGKGKIPARTQQQPSGKGKKGEVLELRYSRAYRQRFSEE